MENIQNKSLESTESLIESLHSSRRKNTMILNPDFLDDEKLPDKERTAVLKEIFNKNIRQKQLSKIISHLTPVLDSVHPPSAFIYGPTGSGKTVSLIHVLSSFKTVAKKHKVDFKYQYIDLTSPKTYFGALNEVAISLDDNNKKYRKGIPIELMQNQIRKAIAGYTGFLTLLIDEADNIKPNPDLFLTFMVKTLPRTVSCRLILIFLTNRLDWEKILDPRILSFLKKTEILFEPYDALDLLEILKLRVNKALNPEKVDIVALKKMAAIASRETGDARKAIELLSTAVRIAESTNGHLDVNIVDIAENQLEIDKTTELINSLATQQFLALQSCYALMNNGKRKVTTGQTYEVYQGICQKQNHRPLTQRRFCDMISFLDLYGLINARVVSMGRYGKTREIMSSLPDKMIKKIV